MPNKDALPESEWIIKRGMSPRVAPPKVGGSRKPPGPRPAVTPEVEPEAVIEAEGNPAPAPAEDSA